MFVLTDTLVGPLIHTFVDPLNGPCVDTLHVDLLKDSQKVRMLIQLWIL